MARPVSPRPERPARPERGRRAEAGASGADEAEAREFSLLHRPSKGYLFVVTYGRSGSTLTTNLLNAIPGYCIRGENSNALYHVCKLIDVLLREPNLQMRQDQIAGKGTFVPEMGQPSDPWYGAELIDVDQTARRLLNVFCREILHTPPRTRVAGFKEIRYLLDLNFMPRQLEIMQRYFPNARILFLTRDNEEVSNSSWWRGHEKETLLPKLGRADAAFKEYAQSHPNCFHLDYATYAGGAKALKPLFDFLGEEMDEAVVEAVLNHKLTHARHLKGPRAKT